MLVEGRRFFEPIQRNNPLLSPKFQNNSKEVSIVRRYDTRYRARYGHGQTKLITKKKKKKKKGKRGTKLKLIRLPLIFAGGRGGGTRFPPTNVIMIIFRWPTTFFSLRHRDAGGEGEGGASVPSANLNIELRGCR